MPRYTEDDRVRIDLPDEEDPDHDWLHGKHGYVVQKLEDEAEAVTGDERDGFIFRVKLDSGETVDLRWRDLRPPID